MEDKKLTINDMLRTESNILKRGPAYSQIAVRGARIKCSCGNGHDVINLPECHGVYSGEDPIVNVGDMVVGKNIYNGFGVCVTPEGQKLKCIDEIQTTGKWRNQLELRLRIDGEEAISTNAFIQCAKHGGVITVVESGQTATYNSSSKANEEKNVNDIGETGSVNPSSIEDCNKALKKLGELWRDADPIRQEELHKEIIMIIGYRDYLSKIKKVRPESAGGIEESIDNNPSKKNEDIQLDNAIISGLISEDARKKIDDRMKAGGPTLKEAALMADHVYFETSVKEAKQDVLLGGWNLKELYEEGGLRIGVYSRINDNDEEFALVNQGTNDWNYEGEDGIGDLGDNLEQLSGNSEDVKNSISYSKGFVRRNALCNITFIGHSKGGAEAAANAVATGYKAILFNPATVNLSEYGLDESTYDNYMSCYVVEGEALNLLEGFFSAPIDALIFLPQQHPTDTNNLIANLNNLGENHKMPAILSAIDEMEEKN